MSRAQQQLLPVLIRKPCNVSGLQPCGDEPSQTEPPDPANTVTAQHDTAQGSRQLFSTGPAVQHACGSRMAAAYTAICMLAGTYCDHP